MAEEQPESSFGKLLEDDDLWAGLDNGDGDDGSINKLPAGASTSALPEGGIKSKQKSEKDKEDIWRRPASQLSRPAETAEASKPKRPFSDAVGAAGQDGDYRESMEYGAIGFGQFGKYMRNKRLKVSNQNSEAIATHLAFSTTSSSSTDLPPQIFKGLKVYMNGLVQVEMEDGTVVGQQELVLLLNLGGGVYVPYLDRKSLVTHILASSLTPRKQAEFAAYKIATPSWLVASAKAGELLDWRRFAVLAPDGEAAGSKGYAGGKREREDDSRMGERSRQRGLMGMLEPVATAGKGKANGKTGASTSRSAIELSSDSESESEYAAKEKKHGAAAAPTTPAKKSPSKSKNDTPTTDANAPFGAWNNAYLPSVTNPRNAGRLADDNFLDNHTSRDPGFLEGFFKHSRLHYLSTWKAEIVARLAEQQRSRWPTHREALTGTEKDGRTIGHLDFDCFFVSAGLTKRPWLRGKAVAVCHAKTEEAGGSTSEIASVSYEARKFGVRNGMSLGKAKELCPSIQTIPFEFELYEEISRKAYSILLSHCDLLQAVSIDEAYIDVSSRFPPSSSTAADKLEFAEMLRKKVMEATGCPMSVGISHNMLLARLATDAAKPDGAFHLAPEAVSSFLSPLSVRKLPGIGWSLEAKLETSEYETCGDLVRANVTQLAVKIGKGNAPKYMAFARGVDGRHLELAKARASVSVEVNYGIRFDKEEQVKRFLSDVAYELAKRLQAIAVRGGHLSLKIMKRHPSAPKEAPKFLGHGHCDTFTRSMGLKTDKMKHTDDPEVIRKALERLMNDFGFPVDELRGIGAQVTALEEREKTKAVIEVERGQTLLGFRAAAAAGRSGGAAGSGAGAGEDVDDSVEVVGDHDIPPPPAQQHRSASKGDKGKGKQKAEVILLSSDEEEDTKPLKKPKKVKVARPFKQAMKAAKLHALPTALQITDDQLRHFNYSPDDFRCLPADIQAEVLHALKGTDAARTLPRQRQPSLNMPVGKVSSTSSNKPAFEEVKFAVVVPKPVEKEEEAAPTIENVTNEQLVLHKLDPDWFRSLTKHHRRKTLNAAVEYRRKHTVAGDKPKGDPRQEKEQVRVLEFYNAKPAAAFEGEEMSCEAVQDKIEAWVEAAASDGPHEEDVEELVKFFDQCLDVMRGCRADEVVKCLRWWRVCIDQVDTDEAERDEWTAAWTNVRKTVEQTYGCRLKI